MCSFAFVYPFGFNGQEKKDDWRGAGNSMDYGARNYDPRIGRFSSIDPYSLIYNSVSPYAFAVNTPIMAGDGDGRKVIFVNGYWNNGALSWLIGQKVGGQGYWSDPFVKAAGIYFNDQKRAFVDGRGKWNSGGKTRYAAGKAYAEAHFSEIVQGIFDDKGVQRETLKFVTHSMGAAYAEGMIEYLEQRGVLVEEVLHFSAADAGDFKASPNPKTTQINYEGDPVLGYKNDDGKYMISGVDMFGTVKTGHRLPFIHGLSKTDPAVFDAVRDLKLIQFNLSLKGVISDFYQQVTDIHIHTDFVEVYRQDLGMFFSKAGRNIWEVLKGVQLHIFDGNGTIFKSKGYDNK